MEETDNLRLPYLLAAQAQKHVTHNEALRSLDALVQLAIENRDLADPPVTPTDGARYIVASPATGDWSGHEGEIAAFQDAAWLFHAAHEGWIAWVSDEDVAIVYDGTGWVTLSSGGGGGSVNPTPLVGVNATSDTTNRLSVTSPASLFNHEGNGHQLKINKAAADDTASLLYQTGFSGRAELGLTGDDDFHFKVSDDGSTWNDAILIDKSTGAVSFPNTAIGGGGGSGAAGDIEMSFDAIPQLGFVELDGATISGGEATYPGIAARYPWMVSSGDIILPDMRGRAPRGWANGSSNDPDRASRLARAGDGQTGDYPGTYQDDEFEDHSHTYEKETTAGLRNNGASQTPLVTTSTTATSSTGGNETRMKNTSVMFTMRLG